MLHEEDTKTPVPMYYENFDLQNLVTPVKCDELVRLLKETAYDPQETEFLRLGFIEGFDIGYEGPVQRRSESDNIPLRIGSKEELWNKLMKEVKLRRVAGPFKTVPFDNYIQSPIGLVPKDGGNQTRLIFHLSYDFGPDEQDASLNYFTPKTKCSVKYHDLDYAVSTCLKAKEKQQLSSSSVKAWRPIFMGKSDIRSAFRLLPLSRESYP